MPVPTISIIDDDPWAREGISNLVSSLGYETLTFDSAEKFLQSSCIDATACIITDLQMPGLSGLDLQDRLREQGVHTPMIFVTAYPDERLRARAINAGALGFLTKPFDEGFLVQCLHDAAKL